MRTPPPLRELILGCHGWWNLWMLASAVAHGVPRELDALANARQVRAPAVFLLADNDEVVPVEYQRRVVDAYAGQRQIVMMGGAQHNSAPSESTQRQYQRELEWLWKKGMAE